MRNPSLIFVDKACEEPAARRRVAHCRPILAPRKVRPSTRIDRVHPLQGLDWSMKLAFRSLLEAALG
jgi:hypothetical protein